MHRRTSIILIVFTIFARSISLAADAPPVYDMTVHPGAVPAAALRYRLMPEPAELTAGNAATIYMSALLLAPRLDEAQQAQLDQWNDLPLHQLPREEVRQFLHDSYKPVFGQLEIAARRDYCNWDTPWREQSFMALLPHLNGMRQLVKALSLRARLEIAEGRFDDAARTLATGFAMARHVGQGNSVLIEALVGTAMARVMAEPLRDWASAAGAPSLYWSIAALPRPFIDAAAAMRRENVLLWLPDLRAAKNRTITPEQWRNIAEQAVLLSNSEDPGQAQPDFQDQLRVALEVAASLPRARAHLLEQGMPREQVEAMPPLQAVAIWSYDDYERRVQAMEKWFGLPFWQAYPGLAREEQLMDRGMNALSNILFMFVPAMTRAYAGCVMTDRELAALQTIEAIRAHAAAHEGKLPQNLEELNESMPPPIDPMTGGVFDYALGDDNASFTITAEPVDENQPRTAFKYEVRLAP